MLNFHPSVTPSATWGLAEVDRLPGRPDDILADPALTTAEKREVLARRASDDHAVRDAPSLRQLGSGAIVAIDEILRALRTLDLADVEPSPVSPSRKPKRRRRSVRARLQVLARRRNDDDDPPPSPAAACPLGVVSAHRRGWEESAGPEPAAA